MERKKKDFFIGRILTLLCGGLMITAAFAGNPLWTFEPLTATRIAVPANDTAIVQYRVINQSSRPYTLVMNPIPGITQLTSGLGICSSIFMLPGKGSCVLSLQINGAELNQPIVEGPVVCQQGSGFQCYRPSASNILQITQAPPITNSTITVTGSPLTLTTYGSTGQLTITNLSTQVAATNINSDFTGTALDGNVVESGNTCTTVPPGSSCTLTYTAGTTVVPQTNFSIQGTNTNALTAAIEIQPGTTLTAINPNSGTASGGTGVILTGTGLTGATALWFDGVAATSVQVVNSTTVTAVTPAHAAGVVDVVIDTPTGGATLSNGYTYLATAVGQPTGGGVIACLNGGLNNLIAATSDNSCGIPWWAGANTLIGVGGQSTTNGATNTANIVAALGPVPPASAYAAQLCNDFEIDSQGNTPCEPGNTCYNDWFLPAGNNLGATGQLNCLYTNRVAIGGFVTAFYWSSTETNITVAHNQSFLTGGLSTNSKGLAVHVRCVRGFTP